jgi:hypothetical protein
MFSNARPLHLSICAGVTCVSLAAGAAVSAADRVTDASEPYAKSATVATNMPGIRTFADAPKGFDPITAGDADLAAYGFPPRPDPTAEPDHYATWKRAMTAARIRWHGALKAIPNETAAGDVAVVGTEPMSPDLAQGAPATPSSLNWAGVVLTKSLTKWNSGQSFRDIYTIMTVPVGQPSFGSGCDPYHPYRARTWAGLNGYVKNSPVQLAGGQGALIGGFQAFIDCFTVETNYSAIFGWDPGVLDEAFPVHPGDLVYTEVSSPPQGIYNSYLFIEDLTTLTYSAYSIPVDYTFIGNSAEWVVERPCCDFGGYLFPLINSIATYFDGGAALDNGGHTLYPGSQATSAQVISMRDDTNDQNILDVYSGSAGYEGLHGISLNTTGCAYTGGCVQSVVPGARVFP